MPIYRSTCPRNCYGSCGMLSYINGNKLTRVLGDPEHGYTQGRLCPKGYALIQYTLDQNRLKYPMLQTRRGSGIWRRISWDRAYDLLATKFLELYECYGSNLAAGYYKGTGNQGFLHHAVEGMFAGLGPHTYPEGNICMETGDAALRESFEKYNSPDPEEMAFSNLIVLWGANPAVTNVNQMKFIYQARQKGGRLVVIDPIFTKSGERADLYVQIKPGMDAWLAWGIAKLLLNSERINEENLQHRDGWEQYQQHLIQLSMDDVEAHTGIRLEVIKELADLYAESRPAASWLGIGLQRNRYGKEAVHAISALVAMTGNLGSPGGGLYYRHQHIEDFPLSLSRQKGKDTPSLSSSRKIPFNNFARKAQELQDPPLKLLWISCGNPLAQDHNLRAWETLLQQLEMVVTVDLYLTRTAQQSDVILPAASFFEEDDLHLSYWHYWISINQKVLPPFFEAKSDLHIAREFTNQLNTLQPGFSTFPAEKETADWIEAELSPRVKELYALNTAADLYKTSRKRRIDDLSPATIYSFLPPQPDIFVDNTQSSTVNQTDNYIFSDRTHFPYHLLTPQSLLKFHSQYETLTWLNSDHEPVIELAEEIAALHKINDGTLVKIANQNGYLQGRAKINHTLPPNVILVEQSDRYPVNNLFYCEGDSTSTTHFFDCMVGIVKEPTHV